MKWLDRLLGRKTFVVQADFSGFNIISYVKARTKDEAVMKVLNSDIAKNRKFTKVSAWESTEE